MAEICDRNSRWNTLLRVTKLLAQGKAVVGSQVVEIENPGFLAALDRGFLKKRKRSLRNLKSRFKKPIQTPETSSGGECDQSTLCTNQLPNQETKRRRLVNFKKPPNFRNPNFENPISAFPANNSHDGGECDQSPRSTLCTNQFSEKPNQEKKGRNFKKPILGPNSTLFSDSRKRKRRSFEFGESSSEQRLFMHRHIINNTQSLRSTSLPEAAIRSRIIETGGHLEGTVCVIEKDLFPTDVANTQSRLSVPLRQVRERFLFPEEVELLLAHSDRGIRTTLIQPRRLEECEIVFALWGSNTTYVLKNRWNDVCVRNELRAGMHIRLWAFRRNSDLCFALEATYMD